MKKISSTLIVLLIVTNVFAQINSAKLSPFMKRILRDKKTKEVNEYIGQYVHRNDGGQIYLSGMIKKNVSLKESDLNNIGAEIGTRAGNIFTFQIPLQNIELLPYVSGIDYIELNEPAMPLLDNARLYTHVDSVHAGINLPMPYTGKGVVVGVVDAGYDFSHPAYFDTSGVNYRVKKVWLQKNSTGPNPAGYNYGTELTDSLALWALGTDNGQTHATHVSGICGGSGYGGLTDNRKFRGFAFESDMVLVGITPDKSQWISTGVSDMIDGINYIFTYANSVSKPAVVNLSWGSPLGPRDGTGLFSQAIDNLVAPGNIFVCSAGNNGSDSIHIQKTFTANDSIVKTYLEIATTPVGKKTWVDMWGDSGKVFCVEVSLRNNGSVATSGFVCLDDTIHDFDLIGSSNDTCHISFMTSSAEFNGKSRVFLDFDSRILNDSVMITVKGTDGTINFWNSFVYNTSGYYGSFTSRTDPDAVNGDKNISISDIAASNSAIAVGAYASKVNWTDINGNGWTYAGYVAQQYLVPFSSHGPTVDGRVKPDITGPGLTVGSSISSLDSSFMSGQPDYMFITNKYHNPVNNRDYPYGMLSGTSMSGPAVAGIVALMLQVKPDLTPQQVRTILNTTAIKDTMTSTTLPPSGNNFWGHGKANAYGAVQQALILATSVNYIEKNPLNCGLYPNPNTGSFILDYSTDINEKLEIKISNLTGQELSQNIWSVHSGYNYLNLQNDNLSAGIYFVRINSIKGSSLIKMIIQ